MLKRLLPPPPCRGGVAAGDILDRRRVDAGSLQYARGSIGLIGFPPSRQTYSSLSSRHVGEVERDPLKEAFGLLARVSQLGRILANLEVATLKKRVSTKAADLQTSVMETKSLFGFRILFRLSRQVFRRFRFAITHIDDLDEVLPGSALFWRSGIGLNELRPQHSIYDFPFAFL